MKRIYPSPAAPGRLSGFGRESAVARSTRWFERLPDRIVNRLREAKVAQASVLSHDGSDTLTRSVAKVTATDIYGNVLNSAGF